MILWVNALESLDFFELSSPYVAKFNRDCDKSLFYRMVL